ncbi:MAG: efflux transporter outer membrane subunit [Verrucomicrobia bacterium]|nr:efflux transporter outer membrane subunit [Verrucomicrobiota bacterium]
MGFGARNTLLAAVAVLAGCAVGPDFRRPAAPPVNGYTPERLVPRTAGANVKGGEPQRFVEGLDIPGQWWRLFHSRALDELLDESIRNNPNLESAQAALRVAQENVRAQKGYYYPSISANFTPSRNKTATATITPVANTGNPYYSLYTTQLSISYVPDVFGLNRRTVESLQAQADAQKFQLEATYLTLTSNVVAAAIQEAALRGQIDATQETIRIATDTLNIMRKQLSFGQIAGADVATQETALAQVQATLPPLQKALAQQRDLLAALAGRFPSEGVWQKFELADLRLPENIPVSLPSKVVEQRPDIRSAEAQLHSACAEIGVAVANMLPNLTLSGNGGSQALTMAQLFGPGTGYFTLAASMTQPIFEGGTLLHRTRAARATYDQTEAQYRNTVITAFQNVADSLRAIQADADSVKTAAAAEQAAATSLDIARKQLQLGQIAYLTMLQAEGAYYQALISLVQAKAARYADTAALFQALGGGWWNRSDIVPQKGRGGPPPQKPFLE